MIDAFWMFPVVYFGLIFGLAVALSSWIAHDKRREKRIRDMVYNNESWCNENCRHYEECMSNHKDPDDAWAELEDYCCNCPMAKAIDVWERDQQIKKRGSV